MNPEYETVTIPYKGGQVTVKINSRIKVYKVYGASRKGYLADYDEKGLVIFEAIHPLEFEDNLPMELVEGHYVTIPMNNIGGFAFYPEVTILETKDIKNEGADKRNE
jgi:hypothetical protein